MTHRGPLQAVVLAVGGVPADTAVKRRPDRRKVTAARAGGSPRVRCVHPDCYADLFVAVLVPVGRLRGEGDRIALFQGVLLAVQEDVLPAGEHDAEFLAAVPERSGAGVVAWRTHDPLGLQRTVEVRGEQFIDCFTYGLLGDALEVRS